MDRVQQDRYQSTMLCSEQTMQDNDVGILYRNAMCLVCRYCNNILALQPVH
jgi:hypothetical protein